MQFSFRNCTHILTRTQGEKFVDMFLVKTASKGTCLSGENCLSFKVEVLKRWGSYMLPNAKLYEYQTVKNKKVIFIYTSIVSYKTRLVQECQCLIFLQ